MLNRADLIKTLLTVALLVIVLVLSLNSSFYNSSMVDAFMAMALGGAVRPVPGMTIQQSRSNSYHGNSRFAVLPRESFVSGSESLNP